MELLYHVNADDTLIGSVARDEAHRSGLLHRSGMVFLKRPDGTIVVQHRSPTRRTFPGGHDASAAFHVTFGESYAEAAARELVEETGVTAPVEFVGKFVHHDPPEHQVVAVFVSMSDAPIRIDPQESTGYKLVSKRELDRIVQQEPVTPWLRDGWPLARDHV